MERTLLGPLPNRLTAGLVERGLALPLLTVYMLLALKTLKTSALPQLARLRAAVQVSDDVYAGHVQRILYTNPRAEAVLLLSALAVVLAWFGVFRQPFPLVNAYLPPLPLQAILVIAAYTIFGWAGLTLVYSSTRFGLGLGALAKRPLKVNVFDPDGLLPFGGLSLRHSLTVAVTVLLLIIPLGRPTEPSEYAVVLLASLASLSALDSALVGRAQTNRKSARRGGVAHQRGTGTLSSPADGGIRAGSNCCHRIGQPHRQAGVAAYDDVQIAQLAVSQRFFSGTGLSCCSEPTDLFHPQRNAPLLPAPAHGNWSLVPLPTQVQPTQHPVSQFLRGVTLSALLSWILYRVILRLGEGSRLLQAGDPSPSLRMTLTLFNLTEPPGDTTQELILQSTQHRSSAITALSNHWQGV